MSTHHSSKKEFKKSENEKKGQSPSKRGFQVNKSLLAAAFTAT